MARGYLCLMLHAHLPFVHHPEDKDVLEQNWLFEAITETYVPLLQAFEHFVRDDIPFRITMSMTPPLVNMLKNEMLQERYVEHIDKLIRLAELELDRTGNEPHFHGLALMYYRKFLEAREMFVDRYDCDLVEAFKNFQDMGCLEIVTCTATHGFLPLLNVNPQCTKAQVYVAVEHYQQNFGRSPRGIWLAECGYTNGVDEVLQQAGIKYFFVDSHGIQHSDPQPRYGVYAPIVTPNGVAAFGRDVESSKQVWSSKEGYPGDFDYREYYKDIGWEREFDYIKPFIHPEGIRINTGMKYWRITGKSDYKEAYRPDWAEKKAAMHAQDFLDNRRRQAEYLNTYMDRTPIVIAPYDAELFGHWWYEGPMWIDFLVRKITYDQSDIAMITPSEYLLNYPTNQMAQPSSSSWGHKGFNSFWLDQSNDWIYPHLDKAGKRMAELAEKFGEALVLGRTNITKRALNQAARELLLAQSSDWPFIMKTDTMVPYACKRLKQHIARFTKLYEDLNNGRINTAWLEEIEKRDPIFMDVDCAQFFVSRRSPQKTPSLETVQ